MPVFNQFVNDGQGVRIIYAGNVTFDDVKSAQADRYFPQEKLLLQKYYLHDLSLVDKISLTSEEIRIGADVTIAASRINPNILVTAIVPKDFHYGIARMYGVYAEETGWKMKAFRSREEAESWLKERVRERFNLVLESV